MAEKYVKCKYCGRSFRKQGSNYKEGGKYVCSSCAIQHDIKSKTTKRQKAMDAAGMQQTYSEMTMKLIIAAVILCMQLKRHVDGPALAGTVIIAVLILLWAIIPVLRRKNGKG